MALAFPNAIALTHLFCLKENKKWFYNQLEINNQSSKRKRTGWKAALFQVAFEFYNHYCNSLNLYLSFQTDLISPLFFSFTQKSMLNHILLPQFFSFLQHILRIVYFTYYYNQFFNPWCGSRFTNISSLASMSTQGASPLTSSSSSSSRWWIYDVFLSFKGKGTRNSFTDHLYAALQRSGIFTFRDNQWRLQEFCSGCSLGSINYTIFFFLAFR